MHSGLSNQRPFRPGFLVLMGLVICTLLGGIWLWVHRPMSGRDQPADSGEVAPQSPAAEAQASQPVEVIAAPATNAVPTPVFPPSTLAQQGGIQVVGVGLALSGAAVELRYQIIDSEKAVALAKTLVPGILVDAATGRQVQVGTPIKADRTSGRSQALSKALMMRNAGGFPPAMARVRPGATYSILLPNPSGVLRPGSKVNLVVGNLSAEAVPVK